METDFLRFKKVIGTNVFNTTDVYKHFPAQREVYLRQKIRRYIKRGLIYRIKKGFYCFEKDKLVNFQIANYLYQPSYVSCQSALFYYGVIPDVVQETVTSVTTTKTKRISTSFGRFIYLKVKKDFYFGYDILEIRDCLFKIATPAKALLDYFYLNRIKNIDELRLDLSKIDMDEYQKYVDAYPQWVKDIKLFNR